LSSIALPTRLQDIPPADVDAKSDNRHFVHEDTNRATREGRSETNEDGLVANCSPGLSLEREERGGGGREGRGSRVAESLKP
jgi:hypothetical protein